MFSFDDHASRVEQFEYTPRQYEILQQIRTIGRTHIGPAAQQTDREGTFPAAAINALREAGFVGLCVPQEHGGLGAGLYGDALLLPLVLMEIASWCSSTSQVFTLHNTGVQLVHAMGNEIQKTFFFNEILQGHLFASFGSEAGANRFVLESTLQQVDGGYRLTGKKQFATSSTGSKWAFWRSVSSDVAGSQDDRYVMPIVLLSAEGVTVTDDWDGIGQRGTGSGRVSAEHVFIPDGNLLGKPGSYSEHAEFFAAQFQINFAAQFVGMAIGAYREALLYVKNHTRPWGSYQHAAEDPYTQLRLADMATKLAAAQQSVLRAARLLQVYVERPDLQSSVHIAAAHAKITATEVSLDVTNSIFQVMGASSAKQKYGFDMYYRNARTLTLHDPVDRRREVVGKYELGLQEPVIQQVKHKPTEQ
jgi:alkylation response protein AidB-like acyl-CoA dehydrogenase